jgi:hypothetical protein
MRPFLLSKYQGRRETYRGFIARRDGIAEVLDRLALSTGQQEDVMRKRK